MKRLRLVKVIVQPVFVVDDGDTLTELPADPSTVSAAAWPAFAAEGFDQAIANTEAQLNAAETADGDG